MQIRHFRHFRQKPPFSGGTKARFTKSTVLNGVFGTPKTNKHKELWAFFGGTPPGVRPVCPGDTSHLSRDMSRLSRGHSVPLVLIYT